jgi:hypothetical protein
MFIGYFLHYSLKRGNEVFRMENPASRVSGTAEFIRSDSDKATYLEGLYADHLATALLNLGAEFWVMRRRMLVLEKLLAESGAHDPIALEAYEPTPDEQLAWEAQRDAFIRRAFGVLTRDTATLPSDFPSERAPAVEPGSYR